MFLSHYKKWKSRSVSNTVTVRMKRLEEVSDQKELTVEFIQLFNQVRLFVNPWTTAHQASLSITNSRSPPKPMSIELVMPSNHLILCHPLLLLPSIFPSIRVFSNESALFIRWLKYWSFSFNISSSNEHPGLISFRMIYLTTKTKTCRHTYMLYEVLSNIIIFKTIQR